MATLTFVGSTTQSWGATSAWLPAQVPTISDFVIFTASSATCSLNVTGTCSSIDFTNYNKTINFNANPLWVYGNITLGQTMSFTFSTGGQLVMSASGSITPNGMTMGVPFTLYNTSGNNNTYTLNSNLNCTELFSTSAQAGSLTHTINGFTISLYKNLTINGGSVASGTLTTGTTNIIMLGINPTISSVAASLGGLGNNLTINASGSVTFTGTFYYKTGTFRLLGGKLLTVSLANTGNYTLDLSSSNSGNIQNITLLGAVTGTTITILSDAYILGLSVTNIASTIINGGDIYAYGSSPFSIQGSSNVSGTTNFRICGTSSSSNSTINNSGNINCNISIQTSGTLNWNQVLWYAQTGGASLVYTSGTILFNGSNFQIGNGTNMHTFYTSGITFNNMTAISANTNINLQQQLNIGTLNLNTSTYITATGNSGFNLSNLNFVGAGVAGRVGLKLVAGTTNSVTNSLILTPSNYTGNIFGLNTNIPGQQARFILAPTASQNVHSVVTDDIDSSAGQTIWCFNYNGVTQSTNTLNWNKLQATNMSGGFGYIN